MSFLLDTNVLLWWLSDDDRLSPAARTTIADPAHRILVSVASLWEIVVKIRIGKLEADIEAIEKAIDRDAFTRLPISPAHLAGLVHLPRHHRDPFDHLLIEQAISEGAVLISDDKALWLYPVALLGRPQ